MVRAYCRGDRQVLDGPGGPGKDRIGTWDTSRIQDFSRVFGSFGSDDCKFFNESLDGWNMSSATNMKVSRVPLSIY